MNNKVTVTGMEVKTKVSTNLLIDNYDSGNWATDDSTFKADDSQVITDGNVVVPLSTTDGINYFYTMPDNVKGDGDAATNSYKPYTTSSALAEDYPEATAGYLEYHFVLKADNTDESSRNINVSELALTYTGTETDTNTAFRVAILAKEFTTATVNGAKTAPGLASPTITKLYIPSGAVNFESGKAVVSSSATGTVTYASSSTASDCTIATVPENQTKYYEVIVRLWLEGEDKTCNVETFKGLDSGKWALSIAFTLETGTTNGVYQITMQ